MFLVLVLSRTGDAPTTSELSTILLPTKVRLMLQVLRYLLGQAMEINKKSFDYCFYYSMDAGIYDSISTHNHIPSVS